MPSHPSYSGVSGESYFNLLISCEILAAQLSPLQSGYEHAK
jgi:hypothetical protein